MGCNCSSSEPAQPQPDAARWYTNVWDRGDAENGEDRLQNMARPNPIRFLPMQLGEVTVLWRQDDGSFYVDGSDVTEKSAGLQYRMSKSLHDNDPTMMATWGSSVQGEDLGDGWVKCDVDAKGLKFLKNMRSESLLDVLATQGFSKERSMVLMSENALPGIDGRWTSSKHAGVKTIQGKTLYWGFGMQFGINYLPMERLSYDHMGMTRKGMLAGNKIDWNDDDCWTRQQNDPYSTTETLRLGARLAANSIGFCCHKGFKPEIPNQDNWSIVHVNGDFSVYTICDGHGLSGHHVADVTKDSLPRLLLQDPRFRRQRRDALVDAFENTQDLLRTADRQGLVKAAVGGTTATVVVHDHAEQKLQVAHVGDSAAVLGRMGQAEQFLAVPLTRVLVVASDGVWTWMKPQEVLDIVAACGAAQPTVAAERVAKEAYERWMQQTGRQAADDIVVLIIDLAARDRKESTTSHEDGFDGCGFFGADDETEESTEG